MPFKNTIKIFKKKYFLALGIISFLILTTVLLLGYFHNEKTPFTNTTTAMGTFVFQTISSKQENPEIVANSITKSIKNLENKISWRKENSDIFKINNASKSDKIKVNDETFDILKKSLEVSRKTDGAFEVTILPISSLWDFSNNNGVVPDSSALKNALTKVGYNNILLVEKNLTVQNLSEAQILDLGGVGKGSACDLALKEYRKKDLNYAIISVGGSIGLYGKKENNQPFNIAIRDPLEKENPSISFANLKLYSGCISTSGAYEQGFTANDTFYHHILDSKTGYSAQTDLLSVTVCHNSGTLTDLLSTACYVLGKDKSLSILKEYDAEAVFVDKNKNVFITPNLKNKFSLTNDNYKICEW